MSGDYFVGHEVLAKAVEESRAKEQENLQALLRVARAAKPFVGMQFPDGIGGYDEDGHPLNYQGVARGELREALKELPEGLLD